MNLKDLHCVLLMVVAYSTQAAAAAGEPVEACVPQSNPLGECYGCDLQVFENDDCTQGFVCHEDWSEDGCLYECPQGYKLVPDFGEEGTEITWSCVEEEGHICPGAFKTFCPEEDDAVPANGVNPNDAPYRCDCDGQLFVSPDCKHADRCSAIGEDTFVFRNAADCTGDETILIDHLTWETECSVDVDNCPGQGGFTLGAIQCGPNIPVDPICSYTEKPFAEGTPCSCDGQVFINSDCTMAFECQLNVPDVAPDGAEGCLVDCPEGQVIYPTFYNGGNVEFTCVDQDLAFCPGEYSINCEDNPVDPSTDSCDCQGQILVSPDCGSAAFCTLTDSGEYSKYELACDEGEIVVFDFASLSWGCRQDDGSCPGAGGFQVGCEASDPGQYIIFPREDKFVLICLKIYFTQLTQSIFYSISNEALRLCLIPIKTFCQRNSNNG